MKIKKFITTIVLTLPLFMLTACGEKKPALDERFVSNVILETYEGILKPIDEFKFYETGTHQLETDREGIILLQSKSFDLNKYLDQEVRVEGEMEEGVSHPQTVLTVLKIAYLNEPSQTELKSYENKAMGFKFKHPASWLIKETENQLELSLEESDIVQIEVFSNEDDLARFTASAETSKPSEVTVAAQKALRFTEGDVLSFYIHNPPKEKIYKIQYSPRSEAEEDEKDLFYEFLKSFQLIYFTQTQGPACGGEPYLACPDDYVCELKDQSEFAEGVCMPIGASTTPDSCPYISPPSGCENYRIADYANNGCPTLYRCVGEEDSMGEDLTEEGELAEDLQAHNDEENEDDDEETLEESEEEEKTYTVPDLSKVTGEYASERLGITMNYPNSWYYAGFGAIDGTLGKVGFSNVELEEPEQAIITLSIQKQDGGRVSKKIGDRYYVFDGPEDLDAVMGKMAQSLAKI